MVTVAVTGLYIMYIFNGDSCVIGLYIIYIVNGDCCCYWFVYYVYI